MWGAGLRNARICIATARLASFLIPENSEFQKTRASRWTLNRARFLHRLAPLRAEQRDRQADLRGERVGMLVAMQALAIAQQPTSSVESSENSESPTSVDERGGAKVQFKRVQMLS